LLRRKNKSLNSRIRRKTKIVSTKNDLPAKPTRRKNSRKKPELRKNVYKRTTLLARPSSTKKPKIKPRRKRLIETLKTKPMRKRERSVKNMKPLNSPSNKSKKQTLRKTVRLRKRLTERNKPLMMPKRHALEKKSKMLRTPVMKPSASKNFLK
jgi:hypothetical protein